MISFEREKISVRTRRAVLRRDKNQCRYCGSRRGPFQMDHVYPVARGGETTAGNLVTACEACNRRKGARVGMWPKPVDYFQLKRERAGCVPRRKTGVILGLVLGGFALTAASPARWAGVDFGSLNLSGGTGVIFLLGWMVFVWFLFWVIVWRRRE